MNILDRKTIIILPLFLAGISSAAQTSSPPANPKAHVLVLGTFHMANPGHDLLNMHVDDMLVPKRQAEIEQFVAALEKFRPTKIAVEVEPTNKEFLQKYQDYLAGKYSLKANEVDQIGLRMAKRLGHKQVYPIDVMADFPFEPVQTFAQKHHQEQILNDDIAMWQKELEAWSKVLADGTVGQALLAINRDEEVRDGEAAYMDFARIAGDGEYPGPDLLAAWYGRNARIFANLRNIITSPDDRVLVIFGSGHEFWLQQNVLQSRDLVLERLSDYVH